MISRKSALALAELMAWEFLDQRDRRVFSGNRETHHFIDGDRLYDFLYAHDYEAWFCNAARQTRSSSQSRESARRPLKDLILKLHTGESVAFATPDWSWEQRAHLGNELLRRLAEDALNSFDHNPRTIQELKSILELDGYLLREGHLLAPESDVLDVRPELDLLDALYSSLALEKKDVAFHHLKLSEAHYAQQKWDDSIANSRKFLECILEQSATKYAKNVKGQTLEQSLATSPAAVRDYLETEGLVDKREKNALSAVYALLSHTGSHPYMAQNDQARLLRHLALTLSQFVLLRLQDVLQRTPKH